MNPLYFFDYNAVLRMRKVTKGKHWWHLDNDSRYWMDTKDHYKHLQRYPTNRKYGMRKKYFVKYESHRKRGVNYLPF